MTACRLIFPSPSLRPPPLPAQPIPLAYATPVIAANPRPTSVTVLAIIGIVLAILGMLGPVGLIPYYVDIGPPDPLILAERRSLVSMLWIWGNVIAMMVLSIWLLVLSIGALRLPSPARQRLRLYAKLELTRIAVAALFMLLVSLPMVRDLPDLSPQERREEVLVLVLGGLLGLLLSVIYPVCLLVFMRRPHVVAAFARNEAYDSMPG
jgi:hypothetical protein